MSPFLLSSPCFTTFSKLIFKNYPGATDDVGMVDTASSVACLSVRLEVAGADVELNTGKVSL
jgi:hypothetical protein